MTQYSPELEAQLEEALRLTEADGTVLFLFQDMIEINEHFQAVFEWFAAHGNKLQRRLQQSGKMQKGWVYFAGADTHCKWVDGVEVPIPTRGVAKEFDLRPLAHELLRKSGLDARLRAAGLVGQKRTECCGDRFKEGGQVCSDCPVQNAA